MAPVPRHAGRGEDASPRSLALVTDERALVARVRAGDERAFEQIFVTYHVPLVRFALAYVKRPDAAHEVVQDVFVRVWEHRVRWDVRDSLRTYLFTSCRNVALNRLRREEVERRWADQAAAPGGDGFGYAPRAILTDAGVEWSELDLALRRAIAALPDRCRETFVLSRQHELTHEEIATVMGVSPKTVQVQIGRALAVLRRALADFV